MTISISQQLQLLSPAKQSNNKQTSSQNNNSLSFGTGYVTLSEQNLGLMIADNIVSPFNTTTLPAIQKEKSNDADKLLSKMNIKSTDRIKNSQDLVDKVNFFCLAAGSGSRFKKLAQTVGDYNKISLPLPVNKKQNFQMLDVPMAMGQDFLDNKGYTTIIADKKSGSMGDIVKHYLAGNEIKDTVVCCGDNVFAAQSSEMTEFFTKCINDKNTHLALVGVERTPEVVAQRFGVLKVEKDSSSSEDVMKLTGFEEKPPLEVAQELTTDKGMNIANTGMFYISKEAMTKLIDEIKNGENNIKKEESEPYDFALATKYIHKKMSDWFGLESAEGSKVKIVDKWEDVGEPEAYYRFLEDVGEGEYLDNFPKELAEATRNSIKERTDLKGDDRAILFSRVYSSLAELLPQTRENAENIEGVKIIVD